MWLRSPLTCFMGASPAHKSLWGYHISAAGPSPGAAPRGKDGAAAPPAENVIVSKLLHDICPPHKRNNLDMQMCNSN